MYKLKSSFFNNIYIDEDKGLVRINNKKVYEYNEYDQIIIYKKIVKSRYYPVSERTVYIDKTVVVPKEDGIYEIIWLQTKGNKIADL